MGQEPALHTHSHTAAHTHTHSQTVTVFFSVSLTHSMWRGPEGGRGIPPHYRRGGPRAQPIITLHGQGIPPISTLMVSEADATVELVQSVYHFAHNALGDSFETLGFQFV